MKRTLSILLTLVMMLGMIPIVALTSGAEDATVTLPTAGWNDAGNYDVSWCTEGTADSKDSVQVDGKWYKVLDYTAATFEIKDAADLAGLSVLTNAVNRDKSISANDAATNKGMRQNPIFANCTFYITADIDLTGKLWTPIAKEFAGGNNSGDVGTTVFGGNLIGSKGDAQNGNGGIITIKGMTVNVVERTTDPARGQAAGLIGVKGGGILKNISLTNAYVASNTKYAVGSFVGRQWGAVYSAGTTDVAFAELRSKGVYENLSSDAVLIKTGNSSELHGAIGGIVGNAADGQYKNYYTNCTFTGSINSKMAQCGGIVGFSENGSGSTAYFTNCVVTAPITTTAEKVGDAKGVGGLVGGGKCNIIAENCYVSSDITCDASVAIYTGGLLGHSLGLGGDMTLSFNNCQFDGTIKSTTYDQNAAFIGTIVNSGVKVSFKNCLNTGVLTNSKTTMLISGMPWIGSVNAPDKADGNAYTFSNNFTAVNSSYIGSVVGDNTTVVTINGTAATDAASILAHAPTAVGINDVKGDLAKTKMPTFFGTESKWTARDGKYPVLTVAKDVADTTYASADYSWLDTDKGGSKSVKTELTTVEQLTGLAKIAKACGSMFKFADFIDQYYILAADALSANIDTLFSATDAAALKAAGEGAEDEPDEPADTDPVDTGDTTPDTQKPATNDTKAPATEAPAEEEKGCGGIIGGGAIALVATLGCALVIGKKREEK